MLFAHTCARLTFVLVSLQQFRICTCFNTLTISAGQPSRGSADALLRNWGLWSWTRHKHEPLMMSSSRDLKQVHRLITRPLSTFGADTMAVLNPRLWILQGLELPTSPRSFQTRAASWKASLDKGVLKTCSQSDQLPSIKESPVCASL